MELIASSPPVETGDAVDRPPTGPRTRKILGQGCWVVALLLPIKLSLTYIALVPLLSLVLALAIRERRLSLFATHTAPVIAPLVFFLLCVSLSALTGVSPARSIPSVLSLLFFSGTLYLFYNHASPRSVLPALVVGQTIAAIHSTIDAVFPDTIPHLFVGKVTESGQLAVTIPILAGLIVSQYQNWRSGEGARHQKPINLGLLVWTAGAFSLVALAVLSFREAIGAPEWVLWTLAIAMTATWVAAISIAKRSSNQVKSIIVLGVLSAPILVNALLVNLKRGPWLGVIVATLFFCSLFAKRLIAVVILVSISAAIFITPIRQRIADSYDHFTISGGRSTIWRIGAELASEYPLGIGYHNSGILRQFAPEIPPELKHFHNNILNVTAESGWLAGLLFIWFIFSSSRFCIRRHTSPILVAVGCAVLSWQAAGLVEYNFGDSEVTLVMWVALGIALQMTKQEQISKPIKA